MASRAVISTRIAIKRYLGVFVISSLCTLCTFNTPDWLNGFPLWDVIRETVRVRTFDEAKRRTTLLQANSSDNWVDVGWQIIIENVDYHPNHFARSKSRLLMVI